MYIKAIVTESVRERMFKVPIVLYYQADSINTVDVVLNKNRQLEFANMYDLIEISKEEVMLVCLAEDNRIITDI
jgi:hypothetical protein